MAGNAQQARLVAGLAGAVLGPTVAVALVLSRIHLPFNIWLVITTGIAIGAASLLILPYNFRRRATIAVVYVLVTPMVMGFGFLVLLNIGCRMSGVCP